MSEDYEPLDQNDELIQNQLNGLLSQGNFEAILQYMQENSEKYEFQITSSNPNQGNNNLNSTTLGIISQAQMNNIRAPGTFMMSPGTLNGPAIRAPMAINPPPMASLVQASLRPVGMNQVPGTINPIPMNRIPLPGVSNNLIPLGRVPNNGSVMPIPLNMMRNLGFNATSNIPLNRYQPHLK
jgi:hypothetical protein